MVSISRQQLQQFQQLQAQLTFAQTQIASLNFEIARLKRCLFGNSSESLDTQAPLFEAILADTALEDQAARPEKTAPGTDPDEKKRRRPIRQALPEALPRVDHRHELPDTQCACGQPLERVGEDVSEQLDCVPAQFFAHHHIRGKYACRCCQTICAAALPAQIIDKGLPAAGLLARAQAAGEQPVLAVMRSCA